MNPTSLARKLGHLGVLQSQIQKWLSGKAREPRQSTLRPIADHYGIPITALYDNDEAAAMIAKLFPGKDGAPPSDDADPPPPPNGGVPSAAAPDPSDDDQEQEAMLLSIWRALKPGRRPDLSSEFVCGRVMAALARVAAGAPEEGESRQPVVRTKSAKRAAGGAK